MFIVCVCSFLGAVSAFIAVMAMGYAETAYQLLPHPAEGWVTFTLIAMIVALGSFIFLVVCVGSRDESGAIRLNAFDRIFTEIQVIMLGILLAIPGIYYAECFANFVSSWDGVDLPPFDNAYIPMPITMAMLLLMGVISATLGLALILSCIKKVKAGEFFWQSFFGLIIKKFYKEVYQGGSTMRRIVIIAVLLCLLSATRFLAPVALILVLIYAPKWVRKYDDIVKGVQAVNSGELDYLIPVEGNDELDKLAHGINQISEATSLAVQNEIKNQRMKTDLISNVSHDLKTPLTSMVTYIDLLKTEGLHSQNAPEYLEILEQKTNRLRHLTEDLFEAAKASSGAIPVRIERVDLLSLLNQGLGELNQSVEENKLQVIINAVDEHYYVSADGQLLWRVVENLLGNAIKYSQENTRIYINIVKEEAGNVTILEMKNISKYSLNIDADELTDRFKRGDESRTTEGSGLGLAIAKDLMKLMEGKIKIDIDGDLFKAKILLYTAPEPDVIDSDFAAEPVVEIPGLADNTDIEAIPDYRPEEKQ
jgi:signal transduction histidine kinase